MEKKRLLYEAPLAQCVEFSHECSLMQFSKKDYGFRITDEWEDLV